MAFSKLEWIFALISLLRGVHCVNAALSSGQRHADTREIMRLSLLETFQERPWPLKHNMSCYILQLFAVYDAQANKRCCDSEYIGGATNVRQVTLEKYGRSL